MNEKKFGDQLAKVRQEKNITQNELGKLLNVSGKLVSKWERGVIIPEPQMLKEISNILDINIDDSLNIETKTNKITKKVNYPSYIALLINAILIIILPIIISDDGGSLWFISIISQIFVIFFTVFNKNKFICPFISILTFLLSCFFFYKDSTLYSTIFFYILFIFIGIITGLIINLISHNRKKYQIPLIIVVCLVIILSFLAFLGIIPTHLHKEADISNIDVEIEQTNRYTSDDIAEVTIIVLNEMKDYPATILNLTYDEISLEEYQDYLNKYNADNIIILSSKFKTYKNLYLPKDSGFESNTSYIYKYLLVKKDNSWHIESIGFF